MNHVYGETEAGGTSFLIIAGTPFDKLGPPQLGSKPLPPLPEKVMSGVLPFALSWTAVLGGVATATRMAEARSRPLLPFFAHQRKPLGAGRHRCCGGWDPVHLRDRCGQQYVERIPVGDLDQF